MCGRFVLQTPASGLVTRFGLDECADFGARYNIPPGTGIPVVRQSPHGKRVLHLLQWGLIPHRAEDRSIGARLNNARGESVAEKPSFRDAFRRRRCLIPADGFYEWRTEGKIRQPYYFSLASGETMAMGGLWESWRSPQGEIVRSVCIVTTGANALMAPIHERMPLIVAAEHWRAWLAASADEIRHLVAPYPASGMQAWPVSRRVSRAAEDDPGLIAAASTAGPGSSSFAAAGASP